MLDIHRTHATPNTKIYFTHSILPSYIDPQNVSTKKLPFATFNKQPFSHTLDLILPAEMYELVQQSLSTFATSHYARVHMKLGEILEPDFLAAYIKQGNITMLSEGRPLIDNCFQLHDGIIRLELDRQTYERCGLQGTPIEDGGKKHQKSRWTITYNLRQRSMKHGKSAFSRLKWACKNVLNRSLTWVFWNANPSSSEALTHASEVLSKHAPRIHEIAPTIIRLEACLCPKLAPDAAMLGEDDSLRLLEYIHILSLRSPRVNANDAVDPHLSRYAVPDFGAGVARRGFVCVRWKGFMPPAFVRDIFLSARRDGFRSNKAVNATQQDTDMNVDVKGDKEEGMWFALIAQGFGAKTSCTTMQFERGHTLTWAIEN